MKTSVIEEHGYWTALIGMGLSHGLTSDINIVEDHPADEGNCDSPLTLKLEALANKLASKDHGHNKFLESICVWIDIDAPRYFWSQFDTYRVGTTKQSESTMHTILKRPLNSSDFNQPIPVNFLSYLNRCIIEKRFTVVKALLPECFLQRRMVCTNYKVLRNIYTQRHNHKLQEWKDFCNDIYYQVAHPYFLV